MVDSFSSIVQPLDARLEDLDVQPDLLLALLHVVLNGFVTVDKVDWTSCNLPDALVMFLCLWACAEAGF